MSGRRSLPKLISCGAFRIGAHERFHGEARNARKLRGEFQRGFIVPVFNLGKVGLAGLDLTGERVQRYLALLAPVVEWMGFFRSGHAAL